MKLDTQGLGPCGEHKNQGTKLGGVTKTFQWGWEGGACTRDISLKMYECC